MTFFFFKVHEIQVLIHLLFTFVTVSVYKALSIPYISKHCLYFQLLFQMSAPLGPLLCNLQFPLSSGRCLYTTRRSVASSKSKKRTFKEANTDKSAVELNSDQKCFFFPLVCFFLSVPQILSSGYPLSKVWMSFMEVSARFSRRFFHLSVEDGWEGD